MSELDLVVRAFATHVRTPWREGLSGAEKVWFLIYSPANERRVRRRWQEFEIATQEAGHSWHHVDLTDAVPRWIAGHRHRDGYFKRPSALPEQSLVEGVASEIRRVLVQAGPNDVVAVSGTASFFGIAKLARVVKCIDADIPGRLLVGFPGSHEGNTYRLLEAGEGWDYLAFPISAQREATTP